MESYEQKYKAALEWMQGMYGGLHGKTKEEAEKYFPELAEPEDEKIRKEIIAFLKENLETGSAEETWSLSGLERWIAWLEKQGQEKHLSESTKDYQGSFTCWNNAHDFRPKHLQRCICYDKYMGGVYCYVYDDISKYWCTQTTEEHDSDGDNHISDYADYRITLWMPLPDTCKDKENKKELRKIEPNLSNSAKIEKDDTLLDLLNKMPSCITVDGIDYHFVLKKAVFYRAYYEGEGEEGSGKVIFGVTAYSPIDLLTEMLEELKEEGLLE